jgi:hypothetical protein
MLAGVLERERATTRPEPTADLETDETAPEPVAPKGRGASSSTRPRSSAAAATKKTTRPRTIHLPDELFERILVQAHRRDKTISEYIAGLLDRHVPDHRVVRSTAAAEDDAA